MKVDASKIEQTTSVLLLSTSTFILNQIATLQDELDRYAKVNTELVNENTKLQEKIRSLEESKA